MGGGKNQDEIKKKSGKKKRKGEKRGGKVKQRGAKVEKIWKKILNMDPF